MECHLCPVKDNLNNEYVHIIVHLMSDKDISENT